MSQNGIVQDEQFTRNVAALAAQIQAMYPTGQNSFAMSVIAGQSAIPVILPSSGTITNGVLSALTALPTAYGGAWMYFPAGASLPSGAGLYWVSSVTTTGGNITTSFASASAAFTPYIPSNPVLITSGGAAYTQTTGADILLANVTLAGGLMGANGKIRVTQKWSTASTVAIKAVQNILGGIRFAQSNSTSVLAVMGASSLQNRGTQSTQIAFAPNAVTSFSEMGGVGVGAGFLYTSIDTSISQPLTFTGQLVSSPADYIVLEGFTVEVLPRA